VLLRGPDPWILASFLSLRLLSISAEAETNGFDRSTKVDFWWWSAEDRFIFGVLYSIFSVVKFQFRLFSVTDIS